MFVVSMAIFACAMSAVALVGVWLIISASASTERRMDSFASALNKLSNQSTTVLRAEVDALVGALDASRISNRREFGAIWGRLGGKREEANGSVLQTRQVGDDSFEAMLALQSSPPSKP